MSDHIFLIYITVKLTYRRIYKLKLTIEIYKILIKKSFFLHKVITFMVFKFFTTEFSKYCKKLFLKV